VPTELWDVEIYCDGPGCQTTTRHSIWADSERQAFGRARAELVRNHGWVRMRRTHDGALVDLCPHHKPHLGTRPKEQTHA
jgi:hypothetical protein